VISLADAVRRAGKIVADNSPVLLTAVGVTGVITTAYLTGKASFKAAAILEENEIYSDPLEVKEKVQLTWKTYIPPALMGAATIAAIIAANRVGSRRAIALAAAYSLSEKAFEEYRSKIIEKIGEKKEREARDELAQDRVSRSAGIREVIVTGNGSVLCYEAFTGRYFLSDMETLRKAENDINHQVIHDSFACLSDLYDLIGLSHTSFSDEVGWNMDKLLELQFSTTLSESGKPCVVVDFKVGPTRHYHRLQ
jgi:hypothetical protein